MMKISNKKEELEWSGKKLNTMSVKELKDLEIVVTSTKSKVENEFLRIQKKIHYLSLIKSECLSLKNLKLQIEEIQTESKKLTKNGKIKAV